jgi:excisionase family DNA binding protein
MLSTAEVADIFRVAPGTAYRWAWEGRLRSLQTGGKYGNRLFYAEDIEAFLNGSRP